MHPEHNRPRYLITPSYLAGPDRSATGQLILKLMADHWQPHALSIGLVFSKHTPDGLLEAVHTSDNLPAVEDECPVSGWEFTSRPGPGRPAAWTVSFAPTTPPELPTALAAALTRPEIATQRGTRPQHQPTSAGAPDDATEPLAKAGWTLDAGDYEYVWCSPGKRAIVIPPNLPGHPEDDAADWLLGARCALDDCPLWWASAHPNTPAHLIRALCTAMADPRPVPRAEPPAPGAIGFTTVHPRTPGRAHTGWVGIPAQRRHR